MAEQTAARPLEGGLVLPDNTVPAFENWNSHPGKVAAVSSSLAPATLSARLCC